MSEIASEPEVVGERVALDAAGTAELVEDEDLARGELGHSGRRGRRRGLVGAAHQPAAYREQIQQATFAA